MANLSLPLLDLEVSALEALRAMHHHRCSGAIARNHERYCLYLAATIVVALSENPSVRLAEVEPSLDLHAEQQSPPPWPEGLAASRVHSFQWRPGDAALHELARETTRDMVFAVHRSVFALLEASPQDCYCKVDGKPVLAGANRGDCPNGHKGAVRCV